MGFRNVIGVAAGLVATTAGLSVSAFAALGDFNFTSTLLQGTAGLTTIQTGQINSTNNNYIAYQNGTDSGQTDNGAGFAGTAIVLASYSTTTTTAPNTTPGNISDGFIESVFFQDLNTGQTQTQSLLGSYLGTVGANATSLGQTYTTGSLTFVFSDGTYTLTNTGIVSPGAPGGVSGASGANVAFVSNGAPEPSAFALIVPGVIGMVGFARRRKSSK